MDGQTLYDRGTFEREIRGKKRCRMDGQTLVE